MSARVYAIFLNSVYAICNRVTVAGDGLARDGLAERKSVCAKENLRSPEDLGNKNSKFFKDGVSVHVPPISFLKFQIFFC